ncbi:unnamed protein product [Zymoseptoria tritici ST99CH_1A5]|uniref:Uncharacterized protein n=2 Tax=Zymoseptoria tritici TaxID=1047171 RepID=A0A2H1FZ80_ZYMTR|nr:unnamed protein product [Zymoseptoria tritici ST99CH_1E4]SMR47800.1 unnamed protein product [Zymoseptoria tritici ST99CH_3D1]SMY21704.1 unnamed protein product [Zymoseptoria tritici ST99CH_1A5]
MTSKFSSAVESTNSTENPSPRSSPNRKANLFADYNPHARSPVKENGFALPGSPSLPEIHAFRSHARTNSDVQGLVKRFEILDVRDRDAELADRSKRHEAELRRAQIAREEAESDVKRLREETRRLKKEGDEGRDRERKVGKRLEVVMEEFANFKEAHASQSAVYEKEVRKARKEAFKNSSMVLKIQEELKSTRSSLRITQSGLDMEKRKLAQRDQETFDAQYSLVALQEELDKLRVQLQVAEDEKNALKTSLKEEEVARVAAEGMIALPASVDEDELMGSPQRLSPAKRTASPLSDDKENAGVVTKKMLDSRRFDEELAYERTRREHAEELAEFLRLECHFRCCPCRASDHAGQDQQLPVAGELGQAFESIRSEMRAILTPPASVDDENDTMTVQKPHKDENSQQQHEAEQEPKQEPREQPDVEMDQAPLLQLPDDFDRSLTMMDEVAPEPAEARLTEDPFEVECAVEDEAEPEQEHPVASQHPPVTETPEDAYGEEVVVAQTQKVPLLPSSPPSRALSPPQTTTPYRSIRTYTTTIPMKFTPSKPSFERAGSRSEDEQEEDAETVPHPEHNMSPRERTTSAPTFDRAAALAAIAWRRGRAKSIADGQATPRKQMLEGVSKVDRRDVSAPMLGQKTMGGNAYKGAASAGRAPARGRLT